MCKGQHLALTVVYVPYSLHSGMKCSCGGLCFLHLKVVGRVTHGYGTGACGHFLHPFFIRTILPLSSEYGTHKPVKPRFWPWLSGESPFFFSCSLFARQRNEALVRWVLHNCSPSCEPGVGGGGSPLALGGGPNCALKLKFQKVDFVPTLGPFKL